MPITEQQPGLKKSASVQKVEKHDFRDQIATADKDGNRRWIYPKKVTGMWFRYRTWFSWLLLGIMFAGPFIRINGNPLLMINVVDGKFSILGQIFWPQDMVIFLGGPVQTNALFHIPPRLHQIQANLKRSGLKRA